MKKKFLKSIKGKSYYILDLSYNLIPVNNYRFNKIEEKLKLLVDKECFVKKNKNNNKKNRLENAIKEIGFEWDSLSEAGHMRQKPWAITITEAIRKYCWLTVKRFTDKVNVPMYQILGGELIDLEVPEIKQEVSYIFKTPGLYGSNLYFVNFNHEKKILRYNACLQKLSIAKELNLLEENLPLGFFEISKSYRYENEKDLQLCNRVSSFYIPELDIFESCLNETMSKALIAHRYILNNIKKVEKEYELLCTTTSDFLEENFEFFKKIVKSTGKAILISVYSGFSCKDGVKIDIEYNIFDSLKQPIEIATCLIDDGSTVFSLGLKFKTIAGIKKSPHILHIVFPFGSIERFAYFLIDRAIKNEINNSFRKLPFWANPIQVRIITYDNNCLNSVQKFALELESLNFRVDIDDRNINYNLKKNNRELKWIPYIITVPKNNKELSNLIMENRSGKIIIKTNKEGVLRELKKEQNYDIIVPRYLPIFLSKRVF
jgi:threonyl-tRNA synthetase